MLNQFAVEILTLPVNQCHSHLIQIPEGMLSRSFGVPSRRDGPPSIWDTHGIAGNVQMRLYQHLILINLINGAHRSRFIIYSGEK